MQTAPQMGSVTPPSKLFDTPTVSTFGSSVRSPLAYWYSVVVRCGDPNPMRCTATSSGILLTAVNMSVKSTISEPSVSRVTSTMLADSPNTPTPTSCCSACTSCVRFVRSTVRQCLPDSRITKDELSSGSGSSSVADSDSVPSVSVAVAVALASQLSVADAVPVTDGVATSESVGTSSRVSVPSVTENVPLVLCVTVSVCVNEALAEIVGDAAVRVAVADAVSVIVPCGVRDCPDPDAVSVAAVTVMVSDGDGADREAEAVIVCTSVGDDVIFPCERDSDADVVAVPSQVPVADAEPAVPDRERLADALSLPVSAHVSDGDSVRAVSDMLKEADSASVSVSCDSVPVSDRDAVPDSVSVSASDRSVSVTVSDAVCDAVPTVNDADLLRAKETDSVGDLLKESLCEALST